MWPAITDIATNLGMSFETVILITVLIGGCMFYAKDFKLGLALQLIATGLLFMWFFEQGMNYAPSLIMFLITLVILCFTLYAVSKQSTKGGVIA